MASADKFKEIPDVDIDVGRFKYVLIKVYLDKGDEEKSKMIVRGYKWAAFHGDVYDKVAAEIQDKGPGLDTECVGGGRIIHDPEKKSIQVFGYSQGFGKADHSISTELLKKKYPDYTNISWSDEGY